MSVALNLLMLLLGACLGALGLWAWLHRPGPPPALPHEDPVETAVAAAFIQVGLPGHLYGPGYDLAPTGKLYEILHHAAATLGVDHELRTVGDVIKWLKE